MFIFAPFLCRRYCACLRCSNDAQISHIAVAIPRTLSTGSALKHGCLRRKLRIYHRYIKTFLLVLFLMLTSKKFVIKRYVHGFVRSKFPFSHLLQLPYGTCLLVTLLPRYIPLHHFPPLSYRLRSCEAFLVKLFLKVCGNAFIHLFSLFHQLLYPFQRCNRIFPL
jgi:hypothetical protein